MPASDELTVAPHSADVRRASDWLDAVGPERYIPPACVDRLMVSLNEVLANVIAHSGVTDDMSSVHLRLDVTCHPKGGQASLTVWDTGRPFNPVSFESHKPAKTLSEAVVGGRGLTMIRSFSDWLAYAHIDGCNRLTFGVRWEQA